MKVRTLRGSGLYRCKKKKKEEGKTEERELM